MFNSSDYSAWDALQDEADEAFAAAVERAGLPRWTEEARCSCCGKVSPLRYGEPPDEPYRRVMIGFQVVPIWYGPDSEVVTQCCEAAPVPQE